MGDHISIKEAVVLTGRNERTIRRMIQAGQITGRKVKVTRGESWLLGTASVIAACGVRESNHDSDTGNDQGMAGDKSGHDMGDVLAILKQQLAEKDRQIEKMQNQIDELIQRDRENNVLLMAQNEKIRLLESNPQKKGLIAWIRDFL